MSIYACSASGWHTKVLIFMSVSCDISALAWGFEAVRKDCLIRGALPSEADTLVSLAEWREGTDKGYFKAIVINCLQRRTKKHSETNKENIFLGVEHPYNAPYLDQMKCHCSVIPSHHEPVSLTC